MLSTVDINGTLFLSLMFLLLLYCWWDSQTVGMMSVLTMILVPYDFVVMIVYVLPLYITSADILTFTQIIFLLLSMVIIGFTLDVWGKERKSKRQSKENS